MTAKTGTVWVHGAVGSTQTFKSDSARLTTWPMEGQLVRMQCTAWSRSYISLERGDVYVLEQSCTLVTQSKKYGHP